MGCGLTRVGARWCAVVDGRKGEGVSGTTRDTPPAGCRERCYVVEKGATTGDRPPKGCRGRKKLISSGGASMAKRQSGDWMSG